MIARPSARTLALASGLALAAHANAQTLLWNNPSGGSASSSLNWSPSQVPNTLTPLVFNVASALSTIPVTYSFLANGSASHTYRTESYTLSCSAIHTSQGGLIVADIAGDVATLILTDGSLTFLGNSTVADDLGTKGTLVVDDDDALLSFLNGANLNVANNASGTLTITNGGKVNVSGWFQAGSNALGTASVTVSGETASRRSTLSVTGVSDSQFGSTGDATGAIANGGLVEFDHDLAIGANVQSVSTATVAGMGLTSKATLSVAGTVFLGGNSVPVAGGIGTLVVNSDGLVDAGTIIVGGDSLGGSGTLQVNTGGSVLAEDLIVGTGGSLDLNGGTIDLSGGSLSYDNTAQAFVLGGPNDPVVALHDHATCDLDVVLGGRVLTLGGGSGSADLATMELRSGADLFSTAAGDIVLGESAGDEGRLTLLDAGSTLDMVSTEIFIAGLSGDGNVTASDGAHASFGFLFLGSNSGASGDVFLGAEFGGITSHDSNAVFIGGTNVAKGGGGRLAIRNAIFDVTSTLADAITVWDLGVLETRHPTTIVTCDKPIRVSNGEFELIDGPTIHAPSIVLESGANLEISNPVPVVEVATINAKVTASSTSVIDIAGPVVMGTGAGAALTASPSTSLMFFSGNTLTLTGGLGSSLGNVSLASSVGDLPGTLISDQGLTLGAGAILSGHGTIDAPGFAISAASCSVASTGSGGIIFKSATTNLSGAPVSGMVQFVAGGSYTGTGTISGIVDADANAVISASGLLTMGANSTNGYDNDGQLFCDDHAVTLVDSNGVALGTLTEVSGGSLAQGVSLDVPVGSTLRGHGTLNTPIVTIAGTIKPGDTGAGANVHTLSTTGNYVQAKLSTYLCHVSPGVEFPSADRIQTPAGKTITISGGTLDVDLLPGYVPDPADFFDVMVAGGGLTGQFASHELPPKSGVMYLADRVRVHFCYADCENDGDKDVFDFLCFQNHFGSGNPVADCEQDGDLDVFDFLCYQNEFGLGCS